MDSKSDWHYGKKTKTLLSKRKKNKGNINALNGLKKVNINITNLLITLITSYLITFLIINIYSICILREVLKMFSIYTIG